MDARRSSGILLHVTSLPGPHGIGDFGAEARQFVDGLARARQGIWQVLPLGPTGYADSPYQSYSAFAGNASFVDLRALAAGGWLDEADLAEAPAFPANEVDYESAVPWKLERLRQAFARFSAEAKSADREELEAFRGDNQDWLPDFALFMSLKRRHSGVAWTHWPRKLISRDPATLESWRGTLEGEIEFDTFVQWQFFRQWRALKRDANERGVRIIGDVPIFVAHDSADVWANQSLFKLDNRGEPTVVAGVPPDYFSATGQLWGNPIYDWDRLAASGYDWWLRRLQQAMKLYDLVRLDHFRGFVAHWEVPAGAESAAEGKWVNGPGADLFNAATDKLGPLPLIAEDLGVITPPVEALRDQFGFPGMRVLQFAFGDDPKAPDYRPHNYVPNCAVYTGTHDNDTTVGWFESKAGAGTTRTAEQIDREREQTLRYLNAEGREIHWDMIRLAMASVARLAVFPMQDVLGLGTEARMNLPGSTTGNWRWRMPGGSFTPRHESRLRELAGAFDRQPFTTPKEK
jgi:4-alpha-glucanotransferase